MARRSRKRVDPFTAGDPVMPWEDEAEFVPLEVAEAFSELSNSASDDHDDCWVEEEREEKRERSASKRVESGSQGRRKKGRERKPPRDEKPPRADAPASSWPTPKPATTKLKPATPKGDEPFEGDEPANLERAGTAFAAQRKKSPMARIVILIVLLTVAVNVIGLVVSCSAALIGAAGNGISELVDGVSDGTSVRVSGGWGSSDDASGLDYGTYKQVTASLEAQELEMFNSLLGRAAAADDEMVAEAATYLDAAFEGYCGLRYADLGIDSSELARWALAGIVRDETSTYGYAYSEDDADTVYVGTCSEEITMPDVDELAWELSSYLHEEVDYDSSKLVSGSVDEAFKARAQQKLESLKQRAEQRDVYFYLDFTGSCDADGSNPVAALDESSWDYKFSRMFGLYA